MMRYIKIDEDITVEGDDDSPSSITMNDNPYQSVRASNHRACAFRLALYYLLEKSNACYISGPFIKIDKLKSGFKNMLSQYTIGTMEAHFEPTLKNKIEFSTETVSSVTVCQRNVGGVSGLTCNSSDCSLLFVSSWHSSPSRHSNEPSCANFPDVITG